MKFVPGVLFVCAVLMFSGCSQKKVSADELLASLRNTGCTVKKEGKIHASLEGAMEAFWLNIDGKRISAYQFSTVPKAELKKKSFQDGFSIGYWAFEFVDANTAEKIERALK